MNYPTPQYRSDDIEFLVDCGFDREEVIKLSDEEMIEKVKEETDKIAPYFLCESDEVEEEYEDDMWLEEF